MGEGCEESYGFLPCSSSLGGSLTLMAMYGYLLLIGANLLSDGSELLLEILNPGVIGGLVLPVLGALPDTLIVIFSGMGSREQAQEQVAVGVGTLAGSTMMLLTIATGGSLLLGRCDIGASGKAVDKQLSNKMDFITTGITTDRATMRNAVIMVLSSVLYATVQVPTLLGYAHDPPAALWGGVICLIMLAVYAAYQMLVPELQRRRMERARKRRINRLRAAHALHKLDGGMMDSMFDRDGKFNQGIVDKLFATFDADKNDIIDADELRAFLTGLALSDDPAHVQEDVDYWMKEFDRNQSGTISKQEFGEELEKWVRAKVTRENVDGEITEVVISGVGEHSTPENEMQLVDVKNDDDDSEEEAHALTPRQIAVKAVSQLLLGTFVCALFSDPMVGAVTSFSKASKIPAFFVGFVVTPFASNSSELVSSLKFAAKKRSKNISLTFSQVYGAVTMNNTLVLGVFLVIIWAQDLSWTYTSEVAIIVGTTVLVGVLGMTRLTWRTWLAFGLLALYPLSVLLVYFLDFVLKLDG